MAGTDYNFENLSLEELARVHKELAAILDKKIATEMKQHRAQADKLQKLAQDILGVAPTEEAKAREKLKQEKPERGPGIYRHPNDHSKTWEGKGRQPSWVKKLLKENEGWTQEDLWVTQEQLDEEKAAAEQATKPEEPKPEQEQAAEETEEPQGGPEERKTSSEWPL